ncbi:caspase domain-containing protein [Crenothrix sp.]|uniref:caspase family protein n=1 Tax=Crenothrix sp. TaxID=3100433 RepID=UPI00374D1A6B
MQLTPHAMLRKAVTPQLTRIFLLGSLLLLTGCATLGANLALNLAKEEEAKGCEASDPGEFKKVELEDCERISRLIKKAGLTDGFVGYDKSGRIKLKGSYRNEEEVDLAYMVALTVVGASSLDISPVTPRDLQEIKMIKPYTASQLSGKNGNKFALLVGISKFQNKISSIETAVKDVESINTALINSGFNEKNITLLTDKQATKANIINAIKELEDKVTPDDSVVVYISTHGTPPNTFGKMGIIPYDLKSDLDQEDMQAVADKVSKDESGDNAIITIAKQRHASLKTAISFDDLQDFITSIDTNKFVAILDTCYSGAALGALTRPVGGAQYAQREQNYSQSQSANNKEELLGSGKLCEVSGYSNAAFPAVLQQAAFNGSNGSKGFSKENQCQQKGGSKGLALTDEIAVSTNVINDGADYEYSKLESFRAAFGNANTQYQQGKIILTATSGHEKSLFDPSKLSNSYFTYYLVKGLEDSHGQIFPAFDYAKVRTQKLVNDTESCRTQTPEMVSTPNACVNFDLSN